MGGRARRGRGANGAGPAGCARLQATNLLHHVVGHPVARPHRDLAAQFDHPLELIVLREHRLRVALEPGSGQDAARGQARGPSKRPVALPDRIGAESGPWARMAGPSRVSAARTERWALRSSSVRRMSMGQSKDTLAHPRATPGPRMAAWRRATSARPLADRVVRSIGASACAKATENPPPDAFPGPRISRSAGQVSRRVSWPGLHQQEVTLLPEPVSALTARRPCRRVALGPCSSVPRAG